MTALSMPRRMTGGTGTTPKIVKALQANKKKTAAQSTHVRSRSKFALLPAASHIPDPIARRIWPDGIQLDPNLTTTTKPRRSPRNHASSKPAARELPLSKGDKPSTISVSTKKGDNVRNTIALRATADANARSKVSAKSFQILKDKAHSIDHLDHRTSGRPKGDESGPPFNSTRHLRPDYGLKTSAKSKKREGRHPEDDIPRQRIESESRRNDKPRKSSAVGRGAQNKASSKSVTEVNCTPEDNAGTPYATESQIGSIQEDDCVPGSRQLLTKDALKKLTRELESRDQTIRRRSATRIAVGDSGVESEDGSSQGCDIDPRERFNRKWGYVPPLDEETIRIIEAIIKDPACAKIMVGIGPGSTEFLFGLYNRNVLSDPSTSVDPREEEIQSISLEGFLQETEEQRKSYEALWTSDMAKCTPDSSKALYQQTLMINLIARHILIYRFDKSNEQIFDFSVEEPWGCLPMPSRLLWAIPKGQGSGARFLTQPKPDLAVCFKRGAVISDRMWKILPESTRGLACFENSSSNASRVFHFLTVEANKAMLDLDSPEALHQCLNDASQALHNIFQFFRDAGPEHEQIFYEKVRFFSIVANRKGVIVRIHRAIRKPDEVSRWELIMPDRPDYRLEFEFREFQRIGDGEEFSRTRTLELVKKILKYATDDLLEMIKAAASMLVKKIGDDLELYRARCEADFYSYGQPNPRRSQTSKHTSVVPSTVNHRVQRLFQNDNLGPGRAFSGQSRESGQTTPKRPHQPPISSRLAPTTKKRGRKENESDDFEGTRAPQSPVRKRRRPSSRSTTKPFSAGTALGCQ